MENHLHAKSRADLYKIADVWRHSEDVDNQTQVFETLSAFTKLYFSRIGNPPEELELGFHESDYVPSDRQYHCSKASVSGRFEISKTENKQPENALDAKSNSTSPGEDKINSLEHENRNIKLHDYNPSFEHHNNQSVSVLGQENESGKTKLADIVQIGSGEMKIKDVIRIFDTDVVCAGVDISHPTFFGLVPSSGHLLYSAGEFLTNISHVMSFSRFINTGACDIEYAVLRWVCDIIGYPEQARGVTVSGTSMGAVLAYATARHVRITDSRRFNSSVIYLTDQSHNCHARALRMVGLNDAVLRRMPTRNYRMDPKCLDQMITDDIKAGLSPFLVIATMGSTSLGAVDPFCEIKTVTQYHNIWFHVDAAIGGFLLLDDSVKDKAKGISMADSITLDFHKGLSAPFGTAAVLMRDGSHLKSAMTLDSAAYISDSGIGPDYSPIDFTFEFTRPFRAFPVWFMLKILGTENMKTAISEKIRLTKYAYESIRDLPNVVTCMEPDLTVIAFRYVPEDGENGNESTRKWHELIAEEGIACLTPTTVDGLFYIRICILSLRSHIDDVDATLLSIQRNLEVIELNDKPRAVFM